MERVISIGKFNGMLVGVSIGSVLANYLYQLITISDYGVALDRSVLQLSIVFVLKLSDIVTKEITK